ncbi:MAG: nucleotide sugar dehydrogenase [Armatimonadetes bacterium]|nr:nucleotide sugar dehydrogenase [Armatimonadota bacterium]
MHAEKIGISTSNAVARLGASEYLNSKLQARTASIGVVGLGYVGLPFAVQAALSGFAVTGFDLAGEKISAVMDAKSYIGDVPDDLLERAISHGLNATTDFSKLANCDVIVIAVPTPLTKNLVPDLSFVINATREIAKHLRTGQLVTLESTTYPGTTEEVMLPILAESGLIVEQDFFLAHSPERVDPGNKTFKTENTTKVVGGVGPNSTMLASTFYAATVEKTVVVSSAKAAEFVKVYENIFRSVNVALVNEMAQLCDRMGLNVWEILDAAFTKPFGIMPFYPGPGVGGHCIPLDPHYLEFKAREYNFSTRFVQLAGEINRSMPRFVVEKATRILGTHGKPLPKARIAVIGVAYKNNIDDYRESPAIDVIRLLQDAGAEVFYIDPHVPGIGDHGVHMLASSPTPEFLASLDLGIVCANHASFDWTTLLEHLPAVLDTRNAINQPGNPKVVVL